MARYLITKVSALAALISSATLLSGCGTSKLIPELTKHPTKAERAVKVSKANRTAASKRETGGNSRSY